MPNLQLPPTIAPISSTDPNSIVGPDWLRWFLSLLGIVNSQAQQIGSTISKTNQNGSINATALPIPALANGNYRVSYYLEKTQADGVSSSTMVTIGWQHGSVARTRSFPTLTLDSNLASDSTAIPIVIDQNSAITYAVAYTSNTPGLMRYNITLWVEQA